MQSGSALTRLRERTCIASGAAQGAAQTDAGSRLSWPARFPGQEFDEETAEREFNIFRWYRCSFGRFTQTDLTGILAGLDLFAYSLQNPIRFADPAGLVTVIIQHLPDVVLTR